MMITFFNSNGIIHKEFEPEGRTVNSKNYLEVLKYLLARIKCVRPDLEHSACQLLQDKMPAHTAINIRTLLTKKGIALFNYPPYSPDHLAPADFCFLS
jgi:hypothetical protein